MNVSDIPSPFGVFLKQNTLSTKHIRSPSHISHPLTVPMVPSVDGGQCQDPVRRRLALLSVQSLDRPTRSTTSVWVRRLGTTLRMGETVCRFKEWRIMRMFRLGGCRAGLRGLRPAYSEVARCSQYTMKNSVALFQRWTLSTCACESSSTVACYNTVHHPKVEKRTSSSAKI